jgi:hypothetical protein
MVQLKVLLEGPKDFRDFVNAIPFLRGLAGGLVPTRLRISLGAWN